MTSSSSLSSLVSDVLINLQNSLCQLDNKDKNDDENTKITNLTQALAQWNNNIEEANFYSSFLSSLSFSSSTIQKEDFEQMENIVVTLHSLLLNYISTSLRSPSDEKESESAAMSNGAQAIKEKTDKQVDGMATQLARDLVQSSKAAATTNKEDSLKISNGISEVLRTLTNCIRWIGSIMEKAQQQQQKPTKKDPLARLMCTGNIHLYCALLESATTTTSIITNKDNNDDDRHHQLLFTAKNQLARNASVLLFRTTHTNPQPLLKIFWIDCAGYKLIAKLLLSSSSTTSLLFSIVRHVHHIAASLPKRTGLNLLNQALQELHREEEKSVEVVQGCCGNIVVDVTTVLAATLSWCIRSKTPTPFPGVDTRNDRRFDIALEILRTLFAMGSTPQQEQHDIMTQMGILLVDILHLPQNADVRIYEVKMAAVTLLMDTPPNYGYYLLANDAIRILVQLLEIQVTCIVTERDLSGTKTSSFYHGGLECSTGKEDAASITPILIVLMKYCSSNQRILEIVKHSIFPKEAEEEYIKARQKLTSTLQSSGQQRGGGAKNMAPIDNPSKSTLRYKLIQLMTWSESNVKRLSSELLWILCNSDPTEFVLRTGFGNAVHMLGMKGLVNIPQQNTTTAAAGMAQMFQQQQQQQ